jgi:hypothetical protein
MRTWVALILAGCSTVHGVKPVGRGALAVEGSLGGPITEVYGAPIPLPLSTVGVTYGVTDTAEVHAAVHPSAMALFNLVGIDVGASWAFLGNDGAVPRLMGDFTIVGAAGDNEPGDPKGGARVFAQPAVTASWDWGRQDRQTVYAGLGAFVEPKPGPHAIAYVAAGNLWGIGPRFQLATELKWLGPYASSADLAPTYYSPGSLGAVSFQLGARYRFGGAKGSGSSRVA